MPIGKRLVAEVIGTFWLVFGGCGSAVLSATYPEIGIGFLGVALAFGLSVLTAVYAIGHISGGHLNPAVSLGLAVGRRFPWREVPLYALAQVAGAIAAAGVLLFVARGGAFFNPDSMLASNGYGRHSAGGFGLGVALVVEIVLTFMFLIVNLGATDARAPKGFAPIAIGLALTLIHLIAIPVTNTSVNPARSTGPALVAGGWALSQLWLFWVAPLAGAALAGLVYPLIGRAGRGAEVSRPEPPRPVTTGFPREAT